METYGEILRKAREERGISLDEAARRTKLKREVLEALEEDAPDRLSSPSYAAFFLKSYARYLGVRLPAASRAPDRAAKEPAGAPARAKIVPPTPEEVPRIEIPRLSGPVVAILGAAVVLLVLLAFLLPRGCSKEAATTPVAGETARPAPAPPAPSVPATPTGPSVVILRADDMVSIRVTSNGDLLLSDLLAAGDLRRVEAKGALRIRASNPSAVRVYVSGRRILFPEDGSGEIVWPQDAPESGR